MTPELDSSAAFRLVAQRDLNDIRALRDNEPFTRYWMRRLTARRDAIAERFYNDPPEKCGKDERESLRLILHELNALVGQLDADEASARASIERLT